jgi:Flp pilus assembly protein TadG
MSSRVRSELGASALVVAVFVAGLALPLAAISVDIARWYVELERVQAAADAAATAGVTYLPDDLASARARAIAIAEDNGYPDDGNTYVRVEVGERPTQLKVTVGSRIPNNFAAAIGILDTTLARSAVADYNGPAPMGSPCNTMGNEPPGSTGAGPVVSQLSVPPGANCSSSPAFWANIAGPDWPKGNGDQFMTRSCDTGVDGCVDGRNTDFDPLGYFYLVRVAEEAEGRPIEVQIYDPAFVAQGDFCEKGPKGNAVNNNNWNAYARHDARTRYAKQSQNNTNQFCTGDVPTTSVATTTSFGLRAPTSTYEPRTAPPVSSCVRQYRGFEEDEVHNQSLREGHPHYNAELAQVFHQWVPFCTFTPAEAGDYYLQVRTNVELSTASPDGEGGYQGNMEVFEQTGDDPSVGGGGANRFAVRAFSDGLAPGAVSVASWERMPIYANAPGAATDFNLVRVIPAAQGKTLVFGFFDVGEAASNGTMRVIPPADSNLPPTLTGCTGTGKVTGSLTGCQISGINSAGWNGRSQQIRVPIPSTYTCDVTSSGGCWFRVAVNFGSGSAVNDSTTWTAKIEGEPVRLVE